MGAHVKRVFGINERLAKSAAVAFAMLAMMSCQYFSLASGLDFRFLSVLANPSVRVRVVEGAFFGFCAFHALRGKN